MEVLKFKSFEESVVELLDLLDFKKIIKGQKKIVLKPNLTCNKKPPVTTPCEFTEEVLKYCLRYKEKDAEVIIAEGSGGCSTDKCFKSLGYANLAEKYKVQLVDLNECKTQRIKSKKFKKFEFIEYPEVLLDSFLISLPILKEHSEAKVTISLKNMLGAFPAKYYKSVFSGWKNKIHKYPIEYAIHDILTCKFPDFAVVDASVGQMKGEVQGDPKEFGLLLGGRCLDVDKKGTEILGHELNDVPHLVLADGLVW